MPLSPQTCRPGAHVPREQYCKAQRQAVLRAIGEYCPTRPLPVVFGMDFGHTDPQVTDSDLTQALMFKSFALRAGDGAMRGHSGDLRC